MPLGIKEAAWCKMFKVALMPALVSTHQIITHTPPLLCTTTSSLNTETHKGDRFYKLSEENSQERRCRYIASFSYEPTKGKNKKRALGYYVS